MLLSMYRYHFFFFFNDTATTEIYTLSLHDALPISAASPSTTTSAPAWKAFTRPATWSSASTRSATQWAKAASPRRPSGTTRSEEYTSELQSRQYLVCRLLLEKKKKYRPYIQF